MKAIIDLNILILETLFYHLAVDLKALFHKEKNKIERIIAEKKIKASLEI